MARLNPSLPALALLLLATATTVRAELPDPTRPPAAMLAAPMPAASAAAGAPQLQSVLLGKGRAPAAVISGQLVVLGGRLGDARLVRVDARSAVLKGPHGETTLSLSSTEPTK